MKIKILLTVIFVCISSLKAGAQEKSMKFPSVTSQDLELKSYDKDESAEALVMFDIGRSSFESPKGSFNVVFERQTRLKVFTKAGFDHTIIEIPYYVEGSIPETVSEIVAVTYNLVDGQIKGTPLNQGNIYDEKVNEYWRIKKFAMPDIKEGSIIEYKYKITSPYLFNLRDWEFQGKIPRMYSEYIVRQIPFYEYTWLLQGASKFDLQSSYIDESSQKEFATAKYKEMVHHFVMKNVPAFRDESFITTINDYILKIDFQLVKINYPDGTSVDYMSTWEKINKELLVNTDFGKYCTASENNAGKILKDYPQILAGSEREKFDFVMNYVKGKFNWDDMRGIFTTRNVKEFMEKKSGSCAEINLFATGMMNAAGLEAYPVLISTRQHGKVFPQYPFLHFFNYVIILVKVNNSDILADATEILCPNDRIPSRCINGKGLVVKKNEADWVILTASDTSVITEKISVTFAPDLENINAELDIMYYSFDALEYRKIFNDDESKIKENWKDKGFDYIDSVSSDSFTEFDAPYRISFNITNPVSRVENKILINPFFNEPVTENPFKQLVRQYPIDMIYPFKREYVSYINLPEEIEIAELPGDFKVANNLVNITYEIKKDNPQMIIVKGSYLFRQPLYQPKDYEKLKFYYKEIITRFNQPLILQKKVETLL